MKNLLLTGIFSLGFTLLSAQFQSEYFRTESNRTDTSRYLLNLNAAGFFHNNEFFSTDEEGYTLTGNYFQPTFRFRVNNDLSFTTGMHILKFHGQDGFNQVNPFFNIVYDFSERGNILIGSYNGGDNNKLPEPLYAREKQFTDLLLNGVLINYNASRWQTRTWLNWERFIETGDPFRERFTFCMSGSYFLSRDEEREIEIPLYFLANHRGGQINNNNQPVETIADLSTGIVVKQAVNFNIIDELEFTGLGFQEFDIDADGQGFALLGQVEGKGDILSAALGYFYGNNWESIQGNPLLFCGDNNSVDTKSMILLKAGIGKSIGRGSSFSMRFEGYLDTALQKMQYTYGIYLIINEDLWKK